MESYVERAPVPALSHVVRTVWIQRTGDSAYAQRDLPTGGAEIHVPLGGEPRLLGPLTGPQVDVFPPHTTVVGVRFRPGDDPARSVAAWQDWAPDAPDELTLGLTLLSEPGRPVRAVAVGAATLDAAATRDLLRDFCSRAGVTHAPLLRGGVPYHQLKKDLDDPREIPGRTRARSEFFAQPTSETTIERLVGMLGEPAPHPRRLTFTPMGGAYNRVAADATAFAHRGERFLLEHVGDPHDPWVDRSWSSAHPEGSGRVYPNFPDPQLDGWARAYHGDNLDRLVAIKRAYDPDQFFDFPQAIRSTERQP